MNWSFRQRRYQELLTIAPEFRPEGLKTDDDIAEALGVRPEKLREWKRIPGWWGAVAAIAADCIGVELRGIYESMVREAKKGSVAAAKFCVEMLGVDKPQQIDLNIRKQEEILHVYLTPPEASSLPALPAPRLIEGTDILPRPEPDEEEAVIVINADA